MFCHHIPPDVLYLGKLFLFPLLLCSLCATLRVHCRCNVVFLCLHVTPFLIIITHLCVSIGYYLLNLPYSPMIIICSPSAAILCVKRSRIWSHDYRVCYMFHFFLFVSSFQLNFTFFNYQAWQRMLSITMCCVVMASVFLWYFPMEWNAGWFCVHMFNTFVCAFFFFHRCQYCHTRFNDLVWLYVNMYFISHRHII